MSTAAPEIEFVEAGDGPPVLFVPGSYSTSAAWRGIWDRMPKRYRLAATSLCGYGKSTETRTEQDLDMGHEIRVVEQAAARIDAPVHLVGHSFGGTIALASALAGSVDILSITTFEANPLWLARQRGRDALFDEARDLADAFSAAVAAGNPDAARLIIDFWGGKGAFYAFPEPVRDYCRATAPVNVLDWRTAFDFAPAAEAYSAIGVPVLLVEGGDANPLMRETTAALTDLIPEARTASVGGAGHFLIASHPGPCADLIVDFLADITA